MSMRLFLYLPIFFIVAYLSFGCETVIASAQIDPLSGIIPDSALAAQIVTTDSTDRMFEIMRDADMTLQMGKTTTGSREQVVSKYKQFLASDVARLAKTDSLRVLGIMSKAKELCDNFNKALWPAPIYLIPTKGRYYGEGVWYTRENAIIMPVDILQTSDEDIMRTMIHEVFHVWSRRHQDKRASIYAIFGYQHLEKAPIWPRLMDDKIVSNPDATELSWYIVPNTKTSKLSQAYIPALSVASGVVPGMSFFSSIEMGWFPINTQTGVISLPSKTADELPALQFAHGDNTGYNIHPEELAADHFMFMITNKGGSNTALGKQKLADFKATMIEALGR
jgi:hypothetical protein